MINIKRKFLWSVWLFLVITGAVMCGNYISKETASKKNNNQLEEEIKKLKIDLALMNAKWHTETVKVKEQKARAKELDMEIRRMRNSNHYPKEEINKVFN